MTPEETFNCAELGPEEGKCLQTSPKFTPEPESVDGIKPVGPCCEIEGEVEKDETKAYKVEADKDDDEKKKGINKKDNEAFEVIEKTAKMDHMDENFEFGLENGINVEKETLWNYRKSVDERKSDNLEKEKIVDVEAPDKNDHGTLVEDDDEKNEGNNDDNSKYLLREKL
ncbi:hypothetical protein F8M41_024137 [Gigaspora margarita]|uniref:Uncharacterized protein n=1 Tax=Gigaspora margarita TaxID=4874 RepID=A0A8H4B0L8_GIGMA|nr:hypothetical protein F8M41_024137 [Gigaspora margarita]